MKQIIYDEYTGYQSMSSSSIEIHRYRTSGEIAKEAHIHDFFEVFCLLEGEVSFFIDGNEIKLEKEDMILIPPLMQHEEKCSGEEYDRIVLWINPWYLNRISSRKTTLSQCFACAEKRGYLLREEPTMRKKIIALLFELLYETREKEFGYDIMYDSLMQQILILLNRHLNLNTQKGGMNIQEVIRYVSLHYTDEITLDFLANKFFISKFYLSRSFELATGKSVYQYILQKRMVMARQLLVYGEKPMDIYQVCGFKQYSNFYRAFKKYYDMSPSMFLKKMNYEK